MMEATTFNPYYSKKHYKPGNIVDGEKIRQLRESRGWTVEEMALRCDMTEDNILRLERNDGNTSTGKIRTMAEALGVHPALLIVDVDEMIREEVEKVKQALAPLKPIKGMADRDTALIRAFAGNDPAFLQVGKLRTDVPEDVLGEVLFLVLQTRMQTAVP